MSTSYRSASGGSGAGGSVYLYADAVTLDGALTALGGDAVSSGTYIAVDPTTGMSYKVEMANGPVPTGAAGAPVGSAAGGSAPAGAADASDPLAAIMNETIFTESPAAPTGEESKLLPVI